MNHLVSVTYFTLLFILIGASYEQGVTISEKEKATLGKFKEVIIPKISQTSRVHKYINDDLYFICWLRASSFDTVTAEKKLLDHLKWREKQNMDTIETEDWFHFEREYPIFTDVQDKEGRPAVEIWFSDWDVRHAVLSGRVSQLLRWVTRIFEVHQRQLFDVRAKGRNVTQALSLTEIGGFSYAQHACARCMPIYAAMTMLFEAQYPGQYETSYIINMVPAFDIIIRAIKPLLSQANRNLIQTYVSKSHWEPVLDERFEKSQLSRKFGGTKVRDYT